MYRSGQWVDVLYRNDSGLIENDRFTEFTSPRYPQDVHGSGCTFSSLIAGLLVKGLELEPAIVEAKNTITNFIGSGFLLTVPLSDDVNGGTGYININARGWN